MRLARVRKRDAVENPDTSRTQRKRTGGSILVEGTKSLPAPRLRATLREETERAEADCASIPKKRGDGSARPDDDDDDDLDHKYIYPCV